MPKYNHAVTIAFEVIGNHPSEVTTKEYRDGLIKWIQGLDDCNGWEDVNVEAPFDSYEVEEL